MDGSIHDAKDWDNIYSLKYCISISSCVAISDLEAAFVLFMRPVLGQDLIEYGRLLEAVKTESKCEKCEP